VELQVHNWTSLLAAGTLSLVISGVAITCRDFLRWRDAIVRRTLANSQVVETDSGLVEYGEFGQGVPLLMIHGTPGGYDQVLETARITYTTLPGLRIIAPSRPGYLRTPIASGPTPAEQARLFADLMTTLGIDKAFILGASGGGPGAIQFAIGYPDRCLGLILEEAVTRSIAVSRSSTPPIFVDLMIYIFRKKAVASVQTNNLKDPVLGALGSAALETLVPFGRRASGVENDRTQFAQLSAWPLGSISCPTLILHGARDKDVPVADAQFAHERIEGSELVILQGADHGMPATHYRELKALIEDFIFRFSPNDNQVRRPAEMSQQAGQAAARPSFGSRIFHESYLPG